MVGTYLVETKTTVTAPKSHHKHGSVHAHSKTLVLPSSEKIVYQSCTIPEYSTCLGNLQRRSQSHLQDPPKMDTWKKRQVVDISRVSLLMPQHQYLGVAPQSRSVNASEFHP